jgi:hypothetical protein
MIDFLNNGRVLIGSQYDKNPLKPRYTESEPDMLLLQTALIGDVKAIRRTKLLNTIYVTVMVLVLLGAIIFSEN